MGTGTRREALDVLGLGLSVVWSAHVREALCLMDTQTVVYAPIYVVIRALLRYDRDCRRIYLDHPTLEAAWTLTEFVDLSTNHGEHDTRYQTLAFLSSSGQRRHVAYSSCVSIHSIHLTAALSLCLPRSLFRS